MDTIQLGIIGVGNMGTGHIGNIRNGLCPEVTVTAVADIDPARLQWAQENMDPAVARFDSAAALRDSGLVNAVLIAVPVSYTHRPVKAARWWPAASF